jgi:hypothetical protein
MYALSFSPAFWDDVRDAVEALPEERLAEIGADPDTVMRMIEETNTCLNLFAPVEVFIDPEGDFTVLV